RAAVSGRAGYGAVGGRAGRGAVGEQTAPAEQAGGQRVRHRLWGPGTLLNRDDHELVIAFDSVGYRHLTAAALTNGLLTAE
ncbi:hypothetical protein AB0J83_39415, partial [Actinoplanes sp. NPDC049596]